MSRIGRMPIDVPNGVEITVAGTVVTVKGAKGTLVQTVPSGISIKQEGNIVNITRPSEEKRDKAMHGLTRTLVNNMVVGVTTGWTKSLEISGVGYRAAKQGKVLTLTVGKSHPVTLEDTEDVTVELEGQNLIHVKGCDKQKVGAFAADIRAERPAEPYKGKGIKYVGERIKRKEGKAGGKK